MSDTHVPTSTVGGIPSAWIGAEMQKAAIQAAINDTAEQVKKLVPSTPSVAWQTIAAMTVRWGIGMWGVRYATVADTVTGETYQQVVGIVAVALCFGWGLAQKRFQAWREHQTAKASAAASAKATELIQAPVAVPVQPASGVAAI